MDMCFVNGHNSELKQLNDNHMHGIKINSYNTSHISPGNQRTETSGVGGSQGFMQDKIIASHTCFGGHMDVNC